MSFLSELRMGVARAFARSGREVRLQPESRWRVTMTDDEIRVADDKGEVRGIAKDELAAVMIETNDSGPWGMDFWWLLLAADRSLACAFPQGATGEKEVMEWLTALPRFDHAAMIEASTSTNNALFPVWKR